MASILQSRGPIAPPFYFNDANVSRHSPEMTGRIILNSMCARLGWPSLAGKRVLDFGCGVRMVRTIVNLELEIGFYAGIDVNAEAIAWLRQNVDDPWFLFVHLDMRNAFYNLNGGPCGDDTLCSRGVVGFDVACMFSVITHQAPEDALQIFRMLRPSAERLYFTAFIDDTVDRYVEKDPDHPSHMSTYAPSYLLEILAASGWRSDTSYPRSPLLFQQSAFVCSHAMRAAG